MFNSEERGKGSVIKRITLQYLGVYQNIKRIRLFFMEKEEENKQLWYLLKSGVLGAARAAVGLPYEHPLDCIKTVMQAQSPYKGMIETTKSIYSQFGIAGFYKGYIPNTLRVMYKQLYRFPLMIYLPQLSQTKIKLFADENLNASASKIVSGLSLGLVDVFLVNPLERLKVWLMTNKQKLKIKTFFTESNNIFKDLFKGVESAAYRQVFSWTSFLLADEIFKQKIREYRGLKKTEMIAYQDLLVISVAVGACNTICIMPFDMAKTISQKRGGSDLWMIQIIRQEFQKNGLKKLYSGSCARMVQYIAQSLLTVKLYDYLETGYRKLKE